MSTASAPPELAVPDDWLADRATFEGKCREWLGLPMPGVPFLFGKFYIRVDPMDESLGPHLLRDGYWESWTSLAFARAVRPGAFVVDAGAHFGWFTLLALARGAARVFAAEPQPEVSALLTSTLHDNGLAPRVDRYTGALGAAWGTADLLTYGKLTGSASLDRHAASGYTPMQTYRVGVAPLDDVLPERVWGRVDVVKVDVEGAERDVWRGMSGTLARNPGATVLMEVGSPRGYDLDAFLRELTGDGWPLRQVDELDGSVADAAADEVLEDAAHALLPILYLRRGDIPAWEVSA